MKGRHPLSSATPRRLPTIVGAVAIGLLSLTGCGSDSSSAQSTVTVTQSASQAVSASPSASLVETTATQSTTGAPGTPVNIEEFTGYSSGGTGYFFQSPSGSIKCAIKLDDPTIPPGCTAEVSVPSANGVSCPGGVDGFYLSVIDNGSAASRCEVGGTPHVANDNGDNGLSVGGRILNPGEAVSADGVTCTSKSDVITCTADRTGRGFRMGVKVNETF